MMGSALVFETLQHLLAEILPARRAKGNGTDRMAEKPFAASRKNKLPFRDVR
jgi:hypothetical protein